MTRKKRTTSEAFFQKMYAPVRAEIQERAIKDAASARRRNGLRSPVARMTPQQRREIGLKRARTGGAEALAAANRARSPEERRRIAKIGNLARNRKMDAAARSKMSKRAMKTRIKRYPDDKFLVRDAAWLESNMAYLDRRWGIKPEWPFPRPRVTKMQRERLAREIAELEQEDGEPTVSYVNQD